MVFAKFWKRNSLPENAKKLHEKIVKLFKEFVDFVIICLKITDK